MNNANNLNGALFLLLCMIFSIWITPDFTFSGVILPNPMPIVMMGLYFFLVLPNFYRINAKRYLFASGSIVALSLILTSGPLLYLGERITGAVQLAYSILFFVVLVETYEGANKRKFWQYVFVLYVVFTVLLLLEFTGILKSFFDYARSILYSRSVYESSSRDLVQYGAVRPNSFMREPAHVALFFSILSLLISLKIRFGFVFLLLSFGLSMFIIRSPISFFMVPAYLIIKYGLYAEVGLKRILVYLLAAFIIVILIVFIAFYFTDRINNIIDGVDFSAASRFIGPPIVTYDILLDYPFFGVGPTADTLIFGYVYDVFFYLGFDYQLRFFTDEVISKRVTNSFFLNFIYFGLAGGILFLYTLYKYIKSYIGSAGAGVYLSLFSGLGFCIGGYVTPMFWALAFLLYASISLYQSNEF